MNSRRAGILLIVGLILLIVAAIGFWQFGAGQVFFPGPTAAPPPTATPSPTFAPPPLEEFTPPPSLEELATQFPELGNLLLNSQLSSVYKDFVVAYQTGGVEAARQLAEDRGLLDEQERVRLTIELDTTDTASLEAELEDNGVQVLGVHENLMDVAIPMRVIEAAASQENPGAIFERISQLDHVVRIRLPIQSEPMDDPIPGEGVPVTGADLWHEAGFTGQGIRVGVLDLGFKDYDQLLGRGLPESVVAMSFVPGIEPEQSDEVHGAAVAEIVHEMAPDAELYLAYYDGDDVSYGNALDWLIEQNVHIISHSAGGVVGPMDGSDRDAAIVDEIAAMGILWVNSAGNEADVHYRGTFTDADGDNCHEFPDGSEAMGLVAGPGGARVFLNWDDWDAVDQDYELYVFDGNGDLIGASEDYQSGEEGQWPVEIVVNNSVPPETTVYAQICSAGATRAVTFDLYVSGYAIEFPVPEHSLVSPADARGSFSVGAVDWASGELVIYSSQGPANDGRMKPEISAPTGVSSESYPAPDTFTGTSASAPHVSGAAALVWSANPDFTAEQVKNYLIENALDVFPEGPESLSGYGALRLPVPEGVDPVVVTEVAATEVAIIATAAPRPGPGGGGGGGGIGAAGTTALALGLVCSGFLVCGFGLVVVGAVALVVGRRRSAPAASPPLPPLPPLAGGAAPRVPPPTEPVPPPSAPMATARPQEFYPPGAGVPATARANLRSASGTLYALQPAGTTLGRAPECEIVLASTQVSRRHATLRHEAMAWAIQDLGSSNGTFLNGERLAPNVSYRLNPGDEIVLGGTGGERLTFTIE
jgi:subtilisin family serine protease